MHSDKERVWLINVLLTQYCQSCIQVQVPHIFSLFSIGRRKVQCGGREVLENHVVVVVF